VNCVNRHRPWPDADHFVWSVAHTSLGHDALAPIFGTLADLDRTQHLRTGADTTPLRNVGCRLPPTARRMGLGPPRVYVLVDGDVVADLGGFADHAETMVR
jgi:hypothetical protein